MFYSRKYRAKANALAEESNVLQQHVSGLQANEKDARARHAKTENEHIEAQKRDEAERLPERELIAELHDAHRSELQVEKKNAERLLKALTNWQSESQHLLASVQPRRPLLLIEVWIKGVSTESHGRSSQQELDSPVLSPNGSFRLRSGAQLLGEQWVPYDAARATGRAGDHWEIDLVSRLCLSRNAEGKPATWPQLQEPSALLAGATPWRVRMKVTHKLETKPPWDRHDSPSETFELRVLSLTNAHSDIKPGKHGSLTISAQVWRWGGTNVVQTKAIEDLSGEGGIQGSSLAQTGDAWTLLFKAPPTELQTMSEFDLDHLSSSGTSYAATFQQDRSFSLTLLLNPSLGGGLGVLDPWDDNADPQIRAMRIRTKRTTANCTELESRLKELQGSDTEEADSLLQKQSEAEELKMQEVQAQLEHMRCEYFEACEHAAALRSKNPSFHPRHWPAAVAGQKYINGNVEWDPQRKGVAHRTASSRPLATPVAITKTQAFTSPQTSRGEVPSSLGNPGVLGGSDLLMSDSSVQVFGACERAVLDSQLRPRAQVELTFVTKSVSQQFDSVAISVRNIESNSLQIQEVAAGRIHEDRLRAAVTRQLNIVLLDIFEKPPTIEVDCTLCSIDSNKTAQKVNHRVSFQMPIGIISFLSSLPVGRIQDAWGLATKEARWQVPEDTQRALSKTSLKEIDNAASCNGGLSQRMTTGNSPVWLAELPLNNSLIVIVSLSMSLGGAADPNHGSTLVEVVVRSEDERLAKSVLATTKHNLLELAHRTTSVVAPNLTHL